MEIVNQSLLSGVFPQNLKSAHITPVIKKPSLDSEKLENYRPVANIKFIAKILEKAASKQITYYLQKHNLFTKYQSAYRKDHSTETALLKIYNDILLNIDKGNEMLLILLDFSAAFDSISHNLLLNRLKERFGFKK